MKRLYPAVFHKEDNAYWVEFPNLEGCQSFGDTLEETMDNAKEALSAYCITLIEQGKQLNPPCDISKIKIADGEFTSLIEVNFYARKQSVKKTLTIPSWLNDVAEQRHINFSNALQEALIAKTLNDTTETQTHI